jgi:hypothetical protein
LTPILPLLALPDSRDFFSVAFAARRSVRAGARGELSRGDGSWIGARAN